MALGLRSVAVPLSDVGGVRTSTPSTQAGASDGSRNHVDAHVRAVAAAEADVPAILHELPLDVVAVPPPDREVESVPTSFGAVRAITTVGVLQFSVLVVMLLRSKVLAMLLRPEGVGIVSTLDQLAQFVAQVAALSIIAAPTRFVARATVDGIESVTAMYSSLLKILLLSTAGGTAAAVTLLYLQPQVLGSGLDAYRTLAIIAAVTAPTLALSGFIANVSAATAGYKTTSVYLLIAALGSLGAAWFGVRLGGIAGLYYGNLIVGVAAVVGLAVYLRVKVPLRFKWRASTIRATVRQHPDIVRYCSTTYVLSFAQPLAYLVVRSLMLQRLGSAEAGYFQAAFTLSSIASALLMQAIRVYLEPVVNSATDDRLRMSAANEFQRIFSVLILLGTLPLVLFPADLVAMLFTRAFTPVSSVVFVFVLADTLFLCNQVYATVLMAVDDFRGYFQAHLAGYVVLCAGVGLLSGPFGLAGVAWSFFLSRVVVFALIHLLLSRRHGLSMAPRAVALVGYAMAALVAGPLLFGHRGVAGIADAALRSAAFAGVAAGTLMFLTNDERAWIAGLWHRLAWSGGDHRRHRA